MCFPHPSLPQQVFVDTVGDAERYADKLSGRFPHVRFTVCPKVCLPWGDCVHTHIVLACTYWYDIHTLNDIHSQADALYPIVSAASIVAKVTRDRALLHYTPEEQGLEVDRNFGSGYPGGVWVCGVWVCVEWYRMLFGIVCCVLRGKSSIV